jgi:hypothetical protein
MNSGSSFFLYLASLAIFLPVYLLYNYAVPEAQKRKLKDAWRRVKPHVAPYLSAIWVALCVFVIPAVAIYFLSRRK